MFGEKLGLLPLLLRHGCPFFIVKSLVVVVVVVVVVHGCNHILSRKK